jgi:putative peptidoglycan lipid II flippase
MIGSKTQPRRQSETSASESPHWRIIGTSIRLACLLALVRGLTAGKDLFVAQCFGAGDEMDAFLIALSIPNYLTTVLGGSLANAFLPRFVGVQQQRGHAAANQMLGSTLVAAAAAFGLVALALAIASPQLTHLLGADFGPDKLTLSRNLLVLMLAAFVVSNLSALVGAALNCCDRFLMAGIAPIAVPGCVLLAVGIGREFFGIYALPIGALVGSTLELGIVAAAATRHGLLRGRFWTVDRRAMKALAVEAAPLVLSSGLLASSLVVDQAMASSAGPGGPSALGYGGKLVSMILTVLVASLTTAVFPSFSRMVSQQRWAELRATLSTILKLTVAVTVPLTLALAAANEWLIRMLFEHGRFTSETTALVAPVQLAYLLQIPFYTAGVVGVRLLNAMGGNRTVLAVAGFGLVANVVGNLVLMKSYGAAGIAASTSLAYLATSTLILTAVYRRLGRTQRDARLPAPHFNLAGSREKDGSVEELAKPPGDLRK